MSNNVVIKDWLSPDERYCILLDELYDIKNKKKIGNVWENFESLKFFLRYSFSVSTLNESIKSEVNEILNRNIITESIQENITEYKDIIKEFLNESMWDSFKDWLSDTAESTVTGVEDFVSNIKKGGKQLYDKISQSEWTDVLDILKKGTLYLAKKLREALYSPVGIVIDAILVASGIGKAIQWIPWAIVVGLDLYELVKGEYEGTLFQHLLFTLFDVFGLVFTGAMAKGLKVTLKGFKSIDDVIKASKTNPTVKKFLQKIPSVLSEISPKIKETISYLKNKYPKGSSFLSGILSYIDTFINKVIETFKPAFSKKVLASGGITAGITAGIGTYGKEKEKEMVSKVDAVDFDNLDMNFEGLL